MKKVRLFLENFLVYGFGGVISKLIPLIMLPIITKLMPSTQYFGLNDLSHSLITFGQALAVMGMYDAMYRMFFDENDIEYKRKVCSTSLTFSLCTSFILFLILIIFRKWFSQLIFSSPEYTNLLVISSISILIGASNLIVAAPTRMQNKKKTYLIVNFASTLVSYAISIQLLFQGYYIIALPLASVITALSTGVIYGIFNREWFALFTIDKKILNNLLKIGLPLLPNFLIYWIFNSSDRLMVAKILGNDFAGIYAIGAKLGACSQLIYTAFAGGWQYFAFVTMKDDNQVKSNSSIFEYLGITSFTATAFIMALSYPIFQILFATDYVGGYIASGYLFLAPLLLMLYQVAGNQFLVIKKTWPNAFILFSGAVINVLLNYALIPILGIEGAAIATLIGYVVSDILCCIVLTKINLMFISRRFIVAAVAMATFIIVWRLFFKKNWRIGLILALIITLINAVLYIAEIKLVIKATTQIVKRRPTI